MNAAAVPSLKEAVEMFLYREADLLDDWELTKWESLLTDDATYLIPPIGVDHAEELTPDTTMFVCSDDRTMLGARVWRLQGSHAFAEKPRSRLRRMISNIRVLQVSGDRVKVSSNVIIHRVRRAEIVVFIGKYIHELVRNGEDFLIRQKKVLLDNDVLKGQGGISVIL